MASARPLFCTKSAHGRSPRLRFRVDGCTRRLTTRQPERLRAPQTTNMSELPLDVLALPLLLQPLTLASAAILVLSALVLWLRHRPTATNGASTPAKAPVKAPKQGANVTEEKDAPKRRSVLLYGTQTGTAERFAKQLKGELQIRYDDTAFEVMDAEEYKAEQQLPQESLVFLLLATYGDGEPTDNAAEFYNWLIKVSQNGEQACLLKVCLLGTSEHCLLNSMSLQSRAHSCCTLPCCCLYTEQQHAVHASGRSPRSWSNPAVLWQALEGLGL